MIFFFSNGADFTVIVIVVIVMVAVIVIIVIIVSVVTVLNFCCHCCGVVQRIIIRLQQEMQFDKNSDLFEKSKEKRHFFRKIELLLKRGKGRKRKKSKNSGKTKSKMSKKTSKTKKKTKLLLRSFTKNRFHRQKKIYPHRVC